MKNQVIELYPYGERNIPGKSPRETFSGWRLCYLLVTIADTIMTLSVSVCTIFCIYLAYTML